ncbi:MAG: response regulator [candidate division Zixibacteria bacterium]|nr:response regulator [candidate division Zixibacteria bacterium]
MKLNILVVDDDKLVNAFLTETLARTGCHVESVLSGEEALERISQRTYDVMVSDIKMKEMDGITLLQKAKEILPELIAIMITAYGTVENAVKAMKLGAYDYLLKPISPDAIELLLVRVSELINLRRENRQLRSDLISQFQNIVGTGLS